MRADNTAALRRAAQQRRQDTLTRARAALRRLATTGEPVTFNTVARQARVSRAWLYAEPDIRTSIQQLGDDSRRAANPAPVPATQRASEASLQQRLEAAHGRNRQLTAEITALRDQLAHAHGELRAARRRGYGATNIGSQEATR